jgi:uncharacterized membrane-anchored protein
MLIRALLVLCLFGLATSTRAGDPAPKATNEEFEASVKFQQGEIALPNGVATLKVPVGFRYVGPEDAQRILEQAWGNPSGSGTQGMLFPADLSPLAEGGWGVVITYEEDGHVSDDDADGINYDDLLKEMKEGIAASNEERKKQGYESIELVGWAAKPYYDKATKKLHWAKELKFASSAEHTLNYNIRILGRKGVLVLNAVAGMKQLGAIQGRMKEVLAFTDFNQGHAYADFDSKVDKTAAYGLAALVAGGVAAKAGLFAKLFAVLLAFKKVVAVGAIAVVAGLAKLFKRKDSA